MLTPENPTQRSTQPSCTLCPHLSTRYLLSLSESSAWHMTWQHDWVEPRRRSKGSSPKIDRSAEAEDELSAGWLAFASRVRCR